MQIQLKINSPHVVHDSFDGETIVVNLKNGNYYSFDKLGAVIWELIDKNIALNKIIDVIIRKFPESGKKAETDINNFIRNLLNENLLVEETGSFSAISDDDQLAEIMVKERLDLFEPPVMNKYVDMQDMLLLDPIHDTDEKGWPSGKDE
jgi:hypothetical protein